MFDYVRENQKDLDYEWDDVYKSYTFCHSFTHGVSGNIGFPIVNFIKIVNTISRPIVHVYLSVMTSLGIAPEFNGVDLVKKVRQSYASLDGAVSKMTTEKLCRYYKDLGILK